MHFSARQAEWLEKKTAELEELMPMTDIEFEDMASWLFCTPVFGKAPKAAALSQIELAARTLMASPFMP